MNSLKHALAVITFIMSLPLFSLVMFIADLYISKVQKRNLTRDELQDLVNKVTPYTVKISLLMYVGLFIYLNYALRN